MSDPFEGRVRIKPCADGLEFSGPAEQLRLLARMLVHAAEHGSAVEDSEDGGRLLVVRDLPDPLPSVDHDLDASSHEQR